jgi:predicted DNA-binding transcriptional regulator AlpA
MNNDRTVRALKIREVMDLTRLSSTTIARLEKVELFPRRRHASPRRVYWLESEILEFLQSRPTGRDESPARA